MTDPGVVLVTSRSFGSGAQDVAGELAAAGLEVVRGPADHDLGALRDVLHDAAAWIAGTGPVTGEHLAAAPSLRILARYGVGVDAVDLPAAAARGVVVTNTPGANSEAVADHAIALLLAALRGVVAGDRRVRSGDWSGERGRELGALTVGIIGFGRIGRGVARRLTAFGSRILAHDPFVDVGALGAVPATLEQLAQRCDVVSLHAPGGHRVIDATWLRGARPGLLVVNTARAELIDEGAVADALRDGRLRGFAADTLSSEGKGTPGPLLAVDLAARVVVTPHVGAQTVEAIDRMGSAAVADVIAVLGGSTPSHPAG